LRKLLRDPLLQFLLLGVILFLADFALHPKPVEQKADDTIVVSAALRNELAASWQQNHGQPPTNEELEGEVETWINQEVLYREGVARGLERDDSRVRDRVASKMGVVLEAKLVLPKPSDEELRAWFASHPGQFDQPPTIDFIHVFVQGDGADRRARAEELLGRLTAGAEPGGLGDRFTGGRHYRQRKRADLEKSFGAEFVKCAFESPVGTFALCKSRHGFHLVRVEKLDPGHAASFESVRLDVEKSLGEDQKARAMGKALAELRQRWKIER
jgi:peptidyl-prolyl cis-trans isomerase C